MPVDIDALKARIDLADLVRRYCDGETTKGGRAFWCCPFHAERTPSFSLTPDGRRWICFAQCGQGDAIDFVQRVEGTDWKGAVALLDGGEYAATARPAAAPTAAPKRDTAAALEAARAIWRASSPGAGSLVETYLRARGIRIAVPPTLRCHGALKHSHSGLVLPAMVAAVQDAGGRLIGIHRTFLAPDGSAKADVPSPKMMLGPVAGGAVRLGPETAHLIVAEGIETALSGVCASYTTAEGHSSAWAAMSTSGLRGMVLPFGVGEVTILADGDEAGRTAAEAAAARWVAEMRLVRVVAAPDGADFNDLLREAG